MQQPDWLLWAWREIGVREVAGSHDNARIIDMFKDVGHASIDNDEVAWCAALLGACLERSGRLSTRSLMARSYLQWGRQLDTARLGAIAVLSRGSNPALGHVGFIVGEADAHVFLLGGNQADAVSVAPFEKSRVLSYRWPDEQLEHTDRRGDDKESDGRSVATPAAPTFDKALAHVLEMEGGFSDDPHDPGGPTNKGITLSVYARWIGEKMELGSRSRLVSQLKRIPDAMVREIYETRYWIPAGCERMHPAIALLHFDAAVNHGVGTAVRILQEAVGADVDGEIGPQTRARAAAKPLAETLVAYAEIRRERYRKLEHFWRFGRGWMRRVDFSLLRAGATPSGDAADTARPASQAGETTTTNPHATIKQKGEIDMSNTIPTTTPQQTNKWWGESMTIWGVLITAASTVLPTIGPLIGLDISAEMVRQLGEQVTQVAQSLGGVIGTILAVYGRVRARAPIERRLVSLKL